VLHSVVTAACVQRKQALGHMLGTAPYILKPAAVLEINSSQNKTRAWIGA